MSDDNSEDHSLQSKESNNDNSNSRGVESTLQTTTSGRVIRKPDRLNLHQCNLQTQGHSTTEYGIDMARVIAQNVVTSNNLVVELFVNWID
jgi:hypothetical protein